jgi:tetraacyldisaccharide 4'-kinase
VHQKLFKKFILQKKIVLKFIQLILLPIAFLYELVLRLRNHIYNTKIVAPTQFDIPTICIGNLAFGGTGKTPHVEYLIDLLQKKYKIAVMSRGYGRKTQGYLFAGEESSALLIGDEPFQIFLGNPNVAVGVCENRVLGIPNLLFDAPETELVLLDDAFQHRQLQCGLNILLTDFERPYYKDFLFPSGYLREYKAAAKRADIIIVTKCKPDLTWNEAHKIKADIKPKDHQSVFFSSLNYSDPLPIFGSTHNYNKKTALLAFASVANPTPFYDHLKGNFGSIKHKTYADHHLLTEREIQDLTERFELIEDQDKIIITTAKDRSKLLSVPLPESFKQLPIFSMDIKPQLLFGEEEKFREMICFQIEQMKAKN